MAKQLDRFEREAIDNKELFIAAKKDLYHYVFMYIRVMQAEFGISHIPLSTLLSFMPRYYNNDSNSVEFIWSVRQDPSGKNIIEITTENDVDFFNPEDYGELNLTALLDALIDCRLELEKKLIDGNRIVEVDWDADDPDDLGELPTIAFVPTSVEDDDVADWLSDEYGFCVNGWSM